MNVSFLLLKFSLVVCVVDIGNIFGTPEKENMNHKRGHALKPLDDNTYYSGEGWFW